MTILFTTNLKDSDWLRVLYMLHKKFNSKYTVHKLTPIFHRQGNTENKQIGWERGSARWLFLHLSNIVLSNTLILESNIGLGLNIFVLSWR